MGCRAAGVAAIISAIERRSTAEPSFGLPGIEIHRSYFCTCHKRCIDTNVGKHRLGVWKRRRGVKIII
jgi:hypothetical protein